MNKINKNIMKSPKSTIKKINSKKIFSNKKAEYTLNENTKLLALVQKISNIGYWKLNLNTNNLSCSEEIYKIFGYENKDFILTYQIFLDSVHPLDRKKVNEAYNSSLTNGSDGYEIEYRIITRNTSEVRYIYEHCIHERDDAGKIIQSIVLVNDITDKKRCEFLLQEKNEEIDAKNVEVNQINKALFLAKEKSEESEEKYKTLYDNAPISYQSLNENGVFIDVNPMWLKTLGYKREEVIGKWFGDFLHQDYVEHFNINFPAFKKRGYVSNVQFKLRRKDGIFIHVSYEGSIGYSKDGKFKQTYCVFKDISEQKRAEEALLKSEERFNLAMKASHDGLFDWNLETNDIYYSPAWKIMLGYEDKELPNDFSIWEKNTDPEDVKKSWELQKKLISKEIDRFVMEFKMKHKDGHWVDILSRAEAIFDETGKAVRIVGTHSDITARLKAEEDYKTLFREMLNGFALHEIILDKAGKPIDYRFLTVNPAFERMTGTKAIDILGRNVLEIFPKTEKKWIEIYGKVALLGEPIFFENYHAELGKYFEVMAYRPFEKRFACIFQDITKRKQAEAEKEKLNLQLSQAKKMESIGRLAGGVAHDFNNMLQAILGNIEIALDHVLPNTPIFINLKDIQNAAERSADITRQLLAFARKQTVVPNVLDLNDTLESMLKLLRRLIGENIDLIWRPGNEVWSIKMDPSQIDQILTNLCINARDAINGNGKITIETDKVSFNENDCKNNLGILKGDYTVMSVSDDGCGMDKETLNNIFEPFFTSKDLGKGTGLGLSTVYGIVEQNQGFINVYSEKGHGTTFKIYLPKYLSKSITVLEKPSENFHERCNETILLVEDEPSILKTTKINLLRYGYNVLSAFTPGEAIRLAQEHVGTIDLLMTDVVMPEMNGRDLSKIILSFYPNIKSLFMSGYTADVIANHGVLEEGINFIQKPFSTIYLGEILRKILKG